MRAARARLGVMFAAVTVVLIAASAAYACAVLTTLLLEPGKGRPGKTVEFTGHNYRSEASSTKGAPSDVVIKLDNRKGTVLWEGPANPDRTIQGSFKIPKVKAGWYTVLATQYWEDGDPVAGSPGRASLRVRRPRKGGAILAPVPGRSSGSTLTGVDARSVPAPPASPALLFAALAGAGLILLTSAYWRRTGRVYAVERS